VGTALHLAHIHQPLAPKRKRRRGGGDGDGGDGPFLIVPRDACRACARHWHHKCWGADLLAEERPNCPCPCGDDSDPAGQRVSTAAWSDLAQHDPAEAGRAVSQLRLREAGAVFVCGWVRSV
jgi:hypothetical protein